MKPVAATSWLSPKLELREAPGAGSGLFAREAIVEGETVIVWGGAYTDAAGAAEAQARGLGAMQWDEDLFSVESDADDDAYRINHCCDGNVWMTDAVTLAARRAIEPGEEVRADYALWEADESYVSAWECRCGSPLCRGRATGRDWRLPELRARYAGHFSPLINARIAKG